MDSLRSRSENDYFPQHPQAVAEKANLASFSVIPPHWNFPNSQSCAVREKKQFDVERKAVDLRRFQNGPAHIKTKSLEPTLGIPKRKTGGDAH